MSILHSKDRQFCCCELKGPILYYYFSSQTLVDLPCDYQKAQFLFFSSLLLSYLLPISYYWQELLLMWKLSLKFVCGKTQGKKNISCRKRVCRLLRHWCHKYKHPYQGGHTHPEFRPEPKTLWRNTASWNTDLWHWFRSQEWWVGAGGAHFDRLSASVVWLQPSPLTPNTPPLSV